MKKNKNTSKYTHVTEAEYKNIKFMQEKGITASKAAKIGSRNPATTYKVFKAGSYQEYKALSSYKKSRTAEESLASVNTISECIRQAKTTGGLIITTHAAFIGFDDLFSFVKEASDNEVTVTFAPIN